MLSLNNIVPLFGAFIPALYQSRNTTIQKQIEGYPLVKFTYIFMWSLFVVLVSCLTIHVNILDSNIIWISKVWKDFSMTTLHYIVVIGFGTTLFSNFVFGLLIDHLDLKNKSTSIPFVLINLFNLFIVCHILFIDYWLTIRS